jgi:hypothetical protein
MVEWLAGIDIEGCFRSLAKRGRRVQILENVGLHLSCDNTRLR